MTLVQQASKEALAFFCRLGIKSCLLRVVGLKCHLLLTSEYLLCCIHMPRWLLTWFKWEAAVAAFHVRGLMSLLCVVSALSVTADSGPSGD